MVISAKCQPVDCRSLQGLQFNCATLIVSFGQCSREGREQGSRAQALLSCPQWSQPATMTWDHVAVTYWPPCLNLAMERGRHLVLVFIQECSLSASHVHPGRFRGRPRQSFSSCGLATSKQGDSLCPTCDDKASSTDPCHHGRSLLV